MSSTSPTGRAHSREPQRAPDPPSPPSPAERNTVQRPRRSQHLAVRRDGGDAGNSPQRRPFARRSAHFAWFKDSCPNVSLRGRRKTHIGRGVICHPISHAEWLQLRRAQLKKTLRRSIEPLEKNGARGVLVKVMLLQYGYTFVGKGTFNTRRLCTSAPWTFDPWAGHTTTATSVHCSLDAHLIGWRVSARAARAHAYDGEQARRSMHAIR